MATVFQASGNQDQNTYRGGGELLSWRSNCYVASLFPHFEPRTLGFGVTVGMSKMSMFVKKSFACLSYVAQIAGFLCNNGHVRIHTRTQQHDAAP